MTAPIFSQDKLVVCLLDLPELNLQGMCWMKDHPQRDLSQSEIRDAVTEIITYTRHCQATAERLCSLSPIPLTTVPILEYAA